MAAQSGPRIPPVFDGLGVGITVHDPETGAIVAVNERLTELYGYDAAELRSMTVGDYTAPESPYSQAEATERIEAAANGERQSFDWHVERADGELLWVSVTLVRADLDGESVVVAEIRDISERKRRERRLDAVFNGTFQFTGLLDLDGTILEANDTALEFGGLQREQVVGKLMWEAGWFAYDEEVQATARAAVERAREGEFVRQELEIMGADGLVTIDFSVRPLEDERGNVTRLVSEGRDISQLVAREAELARSNDLLAQTERMSDTGGWELDVDAGEVSATTGAVEIYQTDDGTLSLTETLSYFAPEDRETLRSAIQRCVASGEPFTVERTITSEAGRERWVRVHGERVADAESPTVRGVIQDVTDRKEREQQLMVSSRVLRHNLRNDLTAMLGYVDELDETVTALATRPSAPAEASGGPDGRSESQADAVSNDDPGEGRTPAPRASGSAPSDTVADWGEASSTTEPAERATRAVESLREATGDLRSIAERFNEFERAVGRSEPSEPVDVAAVVEEVVADHRDRYPAATVTTDLAEATVLGRPEDLRVALDELVDNALEHADTAEPTVGVSVSTVAGGRVVVRVADDGPGIPEMEREVLRRGEETPLLHGSGLGLWLVNWYTTRLSGRVTIDDNSPRGTVVRLNLPAGGDPDV